MWRCTASWPPTSPPPTWRGVIPGATAEDWAAGLATLIFQVVGTMCLLACRGCGAKGVVVTGAIADTRALAGELCPLCRGVRARLLCARAQRLLDRDRNGPLCEVRQVNLTSPAEIKALLERHGFRFSKALGQNFLIEPSVPKRIAEASGADENTLALEVGPGVGCLTSELAQRAGKVVAIELDSALRGILSETLGGYDNIEIIWGDAARLDLAGIVRSRAAGLRPMVCANLPYSVTSPLLAAFIEARCFERITVMIQREVALRLAAAPGSGDYGAFTVFVNWHCEVKKLFDVPPRVLHAAAESDQQRRRAHAPRRAALCGQGRKAHVPLRAGGLLPAAQDALQRADKRSRRIYARTGLRGAGGGRG